MSQIRADPKPEVEYVFSFLSLWSYVGSLKFQDLVRRRDLDVVYTPIDLLAIFAAGGGKPVKERAPQRQAYRLLEMQRWRRINAIPLVLHPRYYPADPALAHRVLLQATSEGSDVAAFVHAGLKAVWADELDIADPPTIASLADRSGLDGDRLMAGADNRSLFERADRLTKDAIARQVFGAPFYIYKGEPFWGQDRIEMLEAAIVEDREPLILPDLS
ncbi:2-hydroxychromene-2-carboxylate isomerase [Beijerinckia sp. L45]|uniref:2-hydroxychromene-2-carboxylate isomerase n=1 Tax=Beijerinckia sp. L45 TaxID=1641855 RepID=UPI001FEF92AC|nr:2-hydroxychromene-2-carboxylate isomerase [Beijerinckia sp. L45]